MRSKTIRIFSLAMDAIVHHCRSQAEAAPEAAGFSVALCSQASTVARLMLSWLVNRNDYPIFVGVEMIHHFFGGHEQQHVGISWNIIDPQLNDLFGTHFLSFWPEHQV